MSPASRCGPTTCSAEESTRSQLLIHRALARYARPPGPGPYVRYDAVGADEDGQRRVGDQGAQAGGRCVAGQAYVDPAGVRLDQAEQRLDRRRLAGPVLAEHAEDRALGHPQGEAVDGRLAAVPLDQPLDPDHIR